MCCEDAFLTYRVLCSFTVSLHRQLRPIAAQLTAEMKEEVEVVEVREH